MNDQYEPSLALCDVHSHILPKLDDGSDNVNDSIKMLQLEKSQGISNIILTPHFYASRKTPDDFLSDRQKSADMLMAELKSMQDMPKLALGAEVLYYAGISTSNETEKLCISGTKMLLLEMPMTIWNSRILQDVQKIYTMLNITPVIAHIDRYLSFQPEKYVAELLSYNVLVQANADFFIDRKTSKIAASMVYNGNIHFIGSDCHDLKQRSPNIQKALAKLQKRIGPEMLEMWLYRMSSMLHNVEYIN